MQKHSCSILWSGTQESASRLKKSGEAIQAKETYQRILSDHPDFGEVEQVQKELEDLNKDMAAIDGEQDRVLDLYREELLSKEKLVDQLTKVQDKKRRLDDERRELLAKLDDSGPDVLDRVDVIEYCETIQTRLNGLSGDFEVKRRILGLLVNNIALEGKTVRIRGLIPSTPPQDALKMGQNVGRIASLTSTR